MIWAFRRLSCLLWLTESTPAPTMLLTKLKTSLGIVAVPSGVAALLAPPLSSSAVVLDVEDRNADDPPPVVRAPPPRVVRMPVVVVAATIEERADEGADAKDR
jgi:hypothetical protein